MDLISIAIVAGGLLAYALVSGRLDNTVLTPSLLFVAFGFAIGAGGFGVAEVDPGHGVIHLIAELTLILVLFSDAVRIDLKRVRRDHDLPLRMLLIGLPLVVAAGTIGAWQLFPAFSLWEAALLAALLAPTDAALGRPVVSSQAVPVRIREAINVESGLNDGIALPAILFLAALAAGAAGEGTVETGGMLSSAVLQITVGPLVGIVLGWLGGRALDAAVARGWAQHSSHGIGILTLAILTYLLAEIVGGNGFIAAFVGGMVFGNTIRHPCTFLFEFMETEGQLLMLITFLIFGAALLPEGVTRLTPAILVYALLSLTVIRMIPIMVSLIGSGVRMPTRLFLGWFGPRGLASILFVLLILEGSDVPHREDLLAAVVVTVALSTLLHGLSAAPLASAYGRLTARMGECAENEAVEELPLREGTGDRR